MSVSRAAALRIALLARKRGGRPIMWHGFVNMDCPLARDAHTAGFVGRLHDVAVYRLPSDRSPRIGYPRASAAGVDKAFLAHFADGECNALHMLTDHPERYR